MEEDSTPSNAEDNDGGSDDDFDLSAEDHSQNTFDENEADSSDDDSSDDDGSDAGDEAEGGDNAPSDSDDDSEDDDKSTTEKKAGTPAFDKDLDDWAVKHGHEKPETDKERKLLQTIRNGQRNFTKSRQAEDKINKAADDAVKPDPKGKEDETARLDAMEANLASERYQRRNSEFFAAQALAGTPVSDAEAEAMSSLLTEYKEKDGKFGVEFLLNDIPRWHNLAKMGISTPTDKSEELDEAGKKAAQAERERIAKASKAKGPTKSAKQTTTAKQKSELDQIWDDDSI